MEWKKRCNRVWTLDSTEIEGKAKIIDVGDGFKAKVTVSDPRFNLSLVEEQEFFESESEAIAFIKEVIANNP